ncbi:Spy/CpxP family protein refolding chaperone [Ferruginibacter sp.]
MNAITNNRWITIIILLMLTANIVTLVLLWTHKSNNNSLPGQPPVAGQVFEFVTKELQLNAAQQQAYKILREEHQKGQRALQDSIRKAKDIFFALLQQPATADTQIQILSSKVAEAEQQLEIFNFKHFQKLRAICNADQQKKFDSIIKDVLRRLAPGRRQGPPPPGMEPGDRMPPPPQ